MIGPFPRGNDGFTLIELLISVAIFSLIIGSIFSFSISQRKYLSMQEQISEMTQNARSAMDMISGEVATAGYSPEGAVINPVGPAFKGVLYDTSQIQIQADLNGNKRTTSATDPNENPNELITYSYDSTNKRIVRKTNIAGVNQPLAENIQNFSFDYLNGQGNPTTVTDEIRQIRISITTRTSKPDSQYSANSGYRTFTLTSAVTPRNLAY